jgi:putative peptidoglycan lipid II flippase
MIVRNSLFLAMIGAVSIMFGMIRDRLLATVVGVGPVLDVYNASFRLPDLLYALMFAFVTAGTVVPFLTQENKHGDIVDPRHKLSSIMLFFAGVIGFFSVVIAVTIPLYARFIVPGFSEEQIVQFIFATRLMLIQPIFLGFASIISCFAQLRNEFLLYGISPLGYSFGIIFGIIALYPRFGLLGLTIGVIVGAMLSLLIQMYSLRHTKLHTVLGFFSKNHIKELFHLAIPRTGTNILTQLRIMFFTGFATTLGPGVLTSYLFAQRITDAVTQVVQQSITTASLPVLSRDFTDHNMGDYTKAVKRYVLFLGTLGVIIGTIIFIFQDKVTWLLYGQSEYNTLITFFLDGFLFILPFQMVNGYFSTALYSAKDTRSVFISNIMGTVCAVAVCYSFRELGGVSLLFGIIAMALVNFCMLTFLYVKKKFSFAK